MSTLLEISFPHLIFPHVCYFYISTTFCLLLHLVLVERSCVRIKPVAHEISILILVLSYLPSSSSLRDTYMFGEHTV